MLGQEVQAKSTFNVGDLERDRNELVTKYKLTKGHHYALTVYYIGG